MEVNFDQHFLMNKKVLEKTVKISEINEKDIILEIGAGNGVLTKRILEYNPKKLISFEIDKKFITDLEKIKNEHNNFEFVIGNALESFDKINFTKIIANIPYSITEPLYRKILETEVKFAVLLHGKRFYDLISSKKSKWHYFVNAIYDIKKVCDVLGGDFLPAAEVKSAVIVLKKKKNLNKNDRFFQELFEKRGRNVRNAVIFSLVDSFSINKKEALKVYDELGIEFGNRVLDVLSNEEFCELARKLEKYLYC